MTGKNLCKPSFPTLEGAPVSEIPRKLSSLPHSWSSYLYQLWGLSLYCRLGLRSTLSQLLAKSTQASGPKLVEALHEIHCKLEELEIMRLEYEGFESLCRLEGSILAANHPSALDAIVLFHKIPRLTCLMRASLSRNPFLRGGARMMDCIPNDTGASFIRQAEQKLKSGANLLIFPEGTRTPRGKAINPFKNGFALIATRNQTPLYTVLIERKHPYLAKGVSALAPTPLPITIRLRAGKVFYPEPRERPREFATRLQRYFESMLRFSGDTIYVEEEAAL